MQDARYQKYFIIFQIGISAISFLGNPSLLTVHNYKKWMNTYIHNAFSFFQNISHLAHIQKRNLYQIYIFFINESTSSNQRDKKLYVKNLSYNVPMHECYACIYAPMLCKYICNRKCTCTSFTLPQFLTIKKFLRLLLFSDIFSQLFVTKQLWNFQSEKKRNNKS